MSPLYAGPTASREMITKKTRLRLGPQETPSRCARPEVAATGLPS